MAAEGKGEGLGLGNHEGGWEGWCQPTGLRPLLCADDDVSEVSCSLSHQLQTQRGSSP